MSNPTIAFPVNEIAVALFELMRPCLADMQTSTAFPLTSNKKPESFLKRKDAREILGISLPTLDKWTKEGKLTGYRIANQIRYKESELLASVAKMQTCN